MRCLKTLHEKFNVLISYLRIRNPGIEEKFELKINSMWFYLIKPHVNILKIVYVSKYIISVSLLSWEFSGILWRSTTDEYQCKRGGGMRIGVEISKHKSFYGISTLTCIHTGNSYR